MNFVIKLFFLTLCLNLNYQIGNAEVIYAPPIKKVKPPIDKKKNKKEESKKKLLKKKLFFRNAFKTVNSLKRNALGSQQANWIEMLLYVFLSLAIVGLIAFIVGAVLVNPLIWIIGGAGFLIGYIYWIFSSLFPIPYYSAVLSIVVAILFALIGVLLFFIGLSMGVLALWVGGLIFIVPIVFWGLLAAIKRLEI